MIHPYSANILAHIEREEKRAARRPSQANYRAMISKAQKACSALLDQLVAGDINLATFQHNALMIIEDTHIAAGVLGRQKAGDVSARSASDAVWAYAPMRDDKPRFDAFMAQIRNKDPRYVDQEGNLRQDTIQNRFNLYTQKARGTANVAYTASSPNDALFDWVMLHDEHCAVCPVRQEGSPYTKLTMPGQPGDGSTPCRVNCGCVWVRYFADDRMPPDVGFVRPSDQTPPVPNDLSNLEEPVPAGASFFAI